MHTSFVAARRGTSGQRVLRKASSDAPRPNGLTRAWRPLVPSPQCPPQMIEPIHCVCVNSGGRLLNAKLLFTVTYVSIECNKMIFTLYKAMLFDFDVLFPHQNPTGVPGSFNWR